METISEQMTAPEANASIAPGPRLEGVQLIHVQLFNLSKIVGTAPFNRYPISVYFINPDPLHIDFPFAVFDPLGPIGVIGLKALRFDLWDKEQDRKIYASSFIRKFETLGKPTIADNTVLKKDNQSVKINPVPPDNEHVEYYDLWFEFEDKNGNFQFAVIDPTLQANQRG